MKRTHTSEVQTPNVNSPNVPPNNLMGSSPHLHLNKKLEVPTLRNMHHQDGIHGRNNVTPDHKRGNYDLLFYSYS